MLTAIVALLTANAGLLIWNGWQIWHEEPKTVDKFDLGCEYERNVIAGFVTGLKSSDSAPELGIILNWLEARSQPFGTAKYAADQISQLTHREITDAAGVFCADCGTELTDDNGRRLSPVPECHALAEDTS